MRDSLNPGEWQVRIERSFQYPGYDIWLINRKRNENYVLKPVKMELDEPHPEAFQLPEPSMRMSPELLKAFAQAISETDGIPSEIREMKAKDAHLQDMRKLVFEKLIDKL